MKKILLALGIFFFLILVSLFAVFNYYKRGAYSSRAGDSNIFKELEISKGQGAREIGALLEKEGLIKNKNFFYFYLWKNKKADYNLQAGEYEFSPNMTIPEIVEKISNGEIVVKIKKMTIPEGFTNEKIITRLENAKPSLAENFKTYATCKCLGQEGCACDKFTQKFSFLKEIPTGIDMEGFLFPDTYFIEEEDTSEILVEKMFNNFLRYVNDDLRSEIERQEKNLFNVITMASIIEREAKTEEDRKIVSGIFWQRIADDHALQSCATLAYFLGIDKPQFSYEDTQTDSPYNTYLNNGLPPGPICNPGIESIKAAIYPTQTDYYYFLSNPENGEMIYSKTIDEHNQNKVRYGL